MKAKLLIFTSIALAGIITVIAFKAASKNPQRGVKEEPTVIGNSQMTDKQKQHSKLFKHSGAKLQELAKRQAGDIEVEVGLGLTTTVQPESVKLPIFQSAVCRADAVIVGTITRKESQLTEDQNFIFTDHEVAVEEILKNNPRAPLASGSSISATREGGAVEWNGRIFRVLPEDLDPPATGERYLMLLHFIPETGAYLMYGDGTFHLTQQAIRALGPTARAEMDKDKTDPIAFIDRIRTYALSNCGT